MPEAKGQQLSQFTPDELADYVNQHIDEIVGQIRSSVLKQLQERLEPEDDDHFRNQADGTFVE
jgi:hypothetical protein